MISFGSSAAKSSSSDFIPRLTDYRIIDGGQVDTVCLYDPGEGTMDCDTYSLEGRPRARGAAVVTSNGWVVYAGGYDGSSVQVRSYHLFTVCSPSGLLVSRCIRARRSARDA